MTFRPMTLGRMWLLDVAALLLLLLVNGLLKSIQEALGVAGFLVSALRLALVIWPFFYFVQWTHACYKQDARRAFQPQSGTSPSYPASPITSTDPRVMSRRTLAWVTAIAISGIGLGLFYWYEYRPSEIRARCESEAIRSAQQMARLRAESYPGDPNWQAFVSKELYWAQDKNNFYVSCVRKQGLDIR